MIGYVEFSAAVEPLLLSHDVGSHCLPPPGLFAGGFGNLYRDVHDRAIEQAHRSRTEELDNFEAALSLLESGKDKSFRRPQPLDFSG